MSSKLAAAKADATYPEPEGAHDQRMATLKRGIADSQASIQRLSLETR